MRSTHRAAGRPAARCVAARRIEAAASHEQAGFDDWRLPNRNELTSIIEDRCFSPALNAVAFPAASIDAYWTGSPVTDGIDEAWQVEFGDGRIEPAPAATQNAERLVRGGPW